MPELPKKKVGIVACSGEELPEGTVTRLAALKVLEQLRPDDSVTICLPLFLAGGEGDRAFARFYPTIAVDGCELRCAAWATQYYSGKPAASIMVRDVLKEKGLPSPQGRRHLDAAGLQAVEATAQQMAATVDELLGKHWDRSAGAFMDPGEASSADSRKESEKTATCSCGSGIPIQEIQMEGRQVTLVALPLIFEQLRQAGRAPSDVDGNELLEQVRIYNPIPAGAEEQYRAALLQEYAAFYGKGAAE